MAAFWVPHFEFPTIPPIEALNKVDVKAKASKRTAPRPYGSVVAVMAKWCCDASEQE